MKQVNKAAKVKSAALVYSVDQGFLPLACISIASLVEHSAKTLPHVTILLHDVDALSRSCAERFLAGFELEVDFVEVDGNWCEPWASALGQPQAKFGILRFDEFLRDKPDRVIILDADTRFVDDITPLTTLDLGETPLAAVDDTAVISDGRVEVFINQLGLPKEAGYFNSGLLVIDPLKWRSNEIGQRAISVLRDRPEILTFDDQCALNTILQGNYTRLGYRWNHLVGSTPRNWPVSIYHYAGNLKPWRLFGARKHAALCDLISSEHFDFYRDKSDELNWHRPLVRSGLGSTIAARRRVNKLVTSGRVDNFHRRQVSPHITQAVTANPHLLD